jgi:hypothetical protein
MMMAMGSFRNQVIVIMGMRDGVAVCAPVMGVHKCVLMNMNMVSDDGIDDDKGSSCQHD